MYNKCVHVYIYTYNIQEYIASIHLYIYIYVYIRLIYTCGEYIWWIFTFELLYGASIRYCCTCLPAVGYVRWAVEARQYYLQSFKACRLETTSRVIRYQTHIYIVYICTNTDRERERDMLGPACYCVLCTSPCMLPVGRMAQAWSCKIKGFAAKIGPACKLTHASNMVCGCQCASASPCSC